MFSSAEPLLKDHLQDRGLQIAGAKGIGLLANQHVKRAQPSAGLACLTSPSHASQSGCTAPELQHASALVGALAADVAHMPC